MKKSKFKMAGVLVMALVFAMMIAGCDDGGGGKAFFGETLTLDGQVWIADWDDNSVTYEKFTGNRSVNSNLGESGSITDGIFNFTIDTPSDLYDIQDVFYWFSEAYNNLNISSPNTQAVRLELDAGAYNNFFFKTWTNGKTSEEDVWFYYVDKDVTITGSGTTGTHDDGSSWTTKNINLNLKAGWNALTEKIDFNTKNNTITTSVFTGDSSRTRWILDEDDWGVYSIGVMNSLNSVENQNNVRHNRNNLRSLFNSKH